MVERVLAHISGRGTGTGLRSALRARCCVCIAAAILAAGCSSNQRGEVGDSSSVSVDDVLRKCGTVYQSLHTLQARGQLGDYREGATKRMSVSWSFARPDKCRLQMGMDVAVVSGQDWWTYDAAAKQFRKHNQFTRTPIETAAYLLSKGVPFIMPALLARGNGAFALGRAYRGEKWQLQGVGWHADAPCYVVVRKSQEPVQIVRLWIDQDRFLLRGWMISVPTHDGRERPVLECDYPDQIIDGKLPSDWLQLKAPTPVQATSKPAAND